MSCVRILVEVDRSFLFDVDRGFWSKLIAGSGVKLITFLGFQNGRSASNKNRKVSLGELLGSH